MAVNTNDPLSQALPATQPIGENDYLPSPPPPQRWGRLFALKTNTRIDLTRREYIIGRARTADISLDSPECSKRHCRIYTLEDKSASGVSHPPSSSLSHLPAHTSQDPSSRLASASNSMLPSENSQTTVATASPGSVPVLCMIEDCSTNGTFINGHRLQKGKAVVLNHGDEIEIKINNFFIYSDSIQESKEKISQDPELESIENEYHISKTLGSGTYAEVKLAIAKGTGQRFAVKIVDKRKAGIRVSNIGRYTNGKVEDVGAFSLNSVAEIKIMLDIEHPNIVKIHEVLQTKKYLYMFLQLVGGGEMFEYLADHLSLPEDLCKFWMYQVLKAVKYLHDRNITHRDIKPENILLDVKKPLTRVLLSDFGLAKVVNDATLMNTMCGTFNYLAPEVVASEHTKSGYSKAVDCWSLGVMMYFLMSGQLPFEAQNDRDLRREILRGHVDMSDPKSVWPKVSAAGKDIIKRFLTLDPLQRITVGQAFQHEWIADDITWLDSLYQQVVPLHSISRSDTQDDSSQSRADSISDEQLLAGGRALSFALPEPKAKLSAAAPAIVDTAMTDAKASEPEGDASAPVPTPASALPPSAANSAWRSALSSLPRADSSSRGRLSEAGGAPAATATADDGSADYSREERRRLSQESTGKEDDEAMSPAAAMAAEDDDQDRSVSAEYSFLETSCDYDSPGQPNRKKAKVTALAGYASPLAQSPLQRKHA